MIFGPLDSWDDDFLRVQRSEEEVTIFGRVAGSDPAGSPCGDVAEMKGIAVVLGSGSLSARRMPKQANVRSFANVCVVVATRY